MNSPRPNLRNKYQTRKLPLTFKPSRLESKFHGFLAEEERRTNQFDLPKQFQLNRYAEWKEQQAQKTATSLDPNDGLLEEALTPAQRNALFWKPEDLLVPDRAQIFAEKNLIMSLTDFVRGGWRVLEPQTELKWSWHIDAICAHLEAVSTGDIKRLLINVPPGHMKSLLVSVFWPAWMWVHLPSWRFLCASSGLTLATRDAGKCKDLITSNWYQEVFHPAWSLKTDSKAKSSYQNTKYGLRHAVSIGAATTGFRGNAPIIDDPIQAMEATSATKRAESIRWYDTAAASRLANPVEDAIVIIMQRLHHGDLSGHVLNAKLDPYEHLMLPSYFEVGRKFHTVLADMERWKEFGQDRRTNERELLFPQQFTAHVLAGAEENLQDLGFAGQHQQRPTPAAGNMFKAEYFCPDPKGKTFWPASLIYDQKIIEAYMCWDTAAKKGVTNDYWAGCLTALGEDGRVLIVPLVLEKMDVPDGEKKVLLEWAKWKKILGASLYGAPIEEGASNATAVVQNARRLMAHKREKELAFEVWRARGSSESDFDWHVPVGWSKEEWEQVCAASPFHPLPYQPKPIKKEVRARGVLSFCKGRSARLVSIDDYITRQWLSQLLTFPLGDHDDAVDSTVTGLERMAGLSNNEAAATAEVIKAMRRKPRS